MAITKVTTRNTKAELVAAYNELPKELKAAKTGKNGESGKNGDAAAGASAAALVASGAAPDGQELSIADIVARLQALTASIGESSSALQSKLTAEATALHRLRSEAAALIEQLKALHEIEVGADTLPTLL